MAREGVNSCDVNVSSADVGFVNMIRSPVTNACTSLQFFHFLIILESYSTTQSIQYESFKILTMVFLSIILVNKIRKISCERAEKEEY